MNLLPLQSQRLLLRRFEAGDVKSFHSYRNDPEVARYQGWEGCDWDEATEFVRRQESQEAGVPGEWLQIAIVLQQTSVHVGDCALKVHGQDPRQATIGVTLARAYQGQGYAAEALSCLVCALFEQHNLHRVTADTDVENKACWTLLERLGLRREAHLKQSLWFKGRWADEYLYAILRKDW